MLNKANRIEKYEAYRGIQKEVRRKSLMEEKKVVPGSNRSVYMDSNLNGFGRIETGSFGEAENAK